MITPFALYEALLAECREDSLWWLGTPFAVMVEAVLVQNTSWKSVEKVIPLLASYMDEHKILSTDEHVIETIVRPLGFSKRRTETIYALAAWYSALDGEEKLSTDELRTTLMALHGIGRETADVISVYAFHRPVMIVDAYTRRLLSRLGFNFRDDEEIRGWFSPLVEGSFERAGYLHRLILEHSLRYCLKEPRCEMCFLSLCPGNEQ